MKQYLQIKCSYCQGEDLIKNGHSENGTQVYYCKDCRKSFQLDYSYNAWKPCVKQQIETQTKSSGAREIARNLGILKDTVVSE